MNVYVNQKSGRFVVKFGNKFATPPVEQKEIVGRESFKTQEELNVVLGKVFRALAAMAEAGQLPEVLATGEKVFIEKAAVDTVKRGGTEFANYLFKTYGAALHPTAWNEIRVKTFQMATEAMSNSEFEALLQKNITSYKYHPGKGGKK